MIYFWTFIWLYLIFIDNTAINIVAKSLCLFLTILKSVLIKTEIWVKEYMFIL